MEKDLTIIYSEEFKDYTEALCRLASDYVSRIRLKFAERAYEKYFDETTRKLVLAYGEEAKKLDKDRVRNFRHAVEYGGSEIAVKDSCLNKASSYRDAIWFLFGIDDDKKEE